MAEENIDEGFENLSGTEKSAILMMLLGEDEAATVLQKPTPREVQHLGYSYVFCYWRGPRNGQFSSR